MSLNYRALLVWLALGLCLSACKEKPAVDPAAKAPEVAPVKEVMTPAPTPEETAWLKLDETLSDTRLPVSKRIGLLNRYIKKYPKAPKSAEAKAFIKELEGARALERPLRQASYEVRQVIINAQRHVFALSLEGKGTMAYAQALFFELAHDIQMRGKTKLDPPLVLTSPNGDAITRDMDVYLGLGSSRLSLFRTVSSYMPELTSGCEVFSDACYMQALNGLSHKLLKVNLYKRSAELDKKGVEAWLKAITITPQTPLLGSSAQAIYTAYRPILKSLAGMHQAMLKAQKRDQILKAYKGALAKVSKDDESVMIKFYDNYTGSHKLVAAAQITDRPYQAYILTGFWMRRMADGTDAVLASSLKQLIKDFDQPLYAQLYEAPKAQ